MALDARLGALRWEVHSLAAVAAPEIDHLRCGVPRILTDRPARAHEGIESGAHQGNGRDRDGGEASSRNTSRRPTCRPRPASRASGGESWAELRSGCTRASVPPDGVLGAGHAGGVRSTVGGELPSHIGKVREGRLRTGTLFGLA